MDAFTSIIPGGSWANGKALLMRGAYQLIQPGGPAPPSYGISEFFGTSQTNNVVITTPPPFTPAPGIGSTFIERLAVRLDPDILLFDRADCFTHAHANGLSNTQWVAQVGALAPPFDYSIVFNVQILFDLSAPYAGLQLIPLWGEAFLEQGTNLGTLS